jgi:magnesium-transporting ATPase (P-type)
MGFAPTVDVHPASDSKHGPATSETSGQNLWHHMTADEAIAVSSSDATTGLSHTEATQRLARFGPNALPEPKSRTLLSVFLSQFKNPLIYLLLIAAVIAAFVGERTDPAVIVAVVLINAIIGTLQEGRAERSLKALRRLASQKTRVIRDGIEQVVEAKALVPGDLLLLSAGDAVPADARLVVGAALQVAEAALTGESLPVTKDLLPQAPDTTLADRRNMIYAGTHVTAGRARGVVVATGVATEVGHIAALAESATESKTPLEARIARFGRTIVFASMGLFGFILVIGLVRDLPMGEVVMVGISQLVGMIPEGLPVAMTIALAVGVQRMVRRGAVVRRLSAVETLGSTTVICTDKTGTLTANEMTVTAIHLPDGRRIQVTGTGYGPDGQLREAGRPVDRSTLPKRANRALDTLLEAAVLCNDAELAPPSESDPRWKPLGDPTEVALLTVAIKAGMIPSDLRAQHLRRAEVPFDADAKMMATQNEGPNGTRVFLKGAPEEVLELCGHVRDGERTVDLSGADRQALRAVTHEMASQALRVLAFAVVEEAEINGKLGFTAFKGKATLLGFMGQIDPPRSEVKEAVARCLGAGIRPVMVTGDHKATGLAIARELGIAAEGQAAVDGRELEAMTDAELAARIDGISVFARVHPAQKLRIVAAYQKKGEVVAMTGDGVNDAPALVRADVGVAMGRTGTDVAKEAAKIVVTDDNFATIVAAIEEGRVVYRNIKKAVLLLFTTSTAEVSVLVLALLFGYPAPFAAVQILWNNLVTEGLITINLIMEPPEGDEMRQRPNSPREPLLGRPLLKRMAIMTPTIIVVTLGWFMWRMSSGVPLLAVQSETFTLLAICEWFNVLNCRSEYQSALTLRVFKNPWLLGGLLIGNLLQVAVIFAPPFNRIFHTTPFDGEVVVALGLLGSVVLWAEEARKFFARRRQRQQDPGAVQTLPPMHGARV